MNDKLDWTQRLGDAFLAQQKDVLDGVQRLRAKAQQNGNLKSTEQQKVTVEPAATGSTQQTIIIEPANPQVVYVPAYNPSTVYGYWGYPAYPPYYWPPYPAYYPGYAFGAGIAFGFGLAAAGAIFGNCNWGGGDVNINVNRATNINVSINDGTRLPRSVHLVALPAAVIEIVPEYRRYSYFVKDDQICIVDPDSYEIVEIIPASGQVARRRGPARLVLTDEERAIVLREVDMRDGSTLGLGALAEGSDVPRDVKVRVLPETVVQKVPKLKGYSFFTAENRLAIVDQQGSKVQLVIEQRR